MMLHQRVVGFVGGCSRLGSPVVYEVQDQRMSVSSVHIHSSQFRLIHSQQESEHAKPQLETQHTQRYPASPPAARVRCSLRRCRKTSCTGGCAAPAL